MNCSFLDMGGCFAPLAAPFTGAWEWLTFWGPWMLVGAGVVAALTLIVLARKALGEPGAIAAAGAIGAVVGAVLSRRNKPQDHENLPANHPDAAPSAPRPRKKRSSILGGSILPWNRK